MVEAIPIVIDVFIFVFGTAAVVGLLACLRTVFRSCFPSTRRVDDDGNLREPLLGDDEDDDPEGGEISIIFAEEGSSRDEETGLFSDLSFSIDHGAAETSSNVSFPDLLSTPHRNKRREAHDPMSDSPEGLSAVEERADNSATKSFEKEDNDAKHNVQHDRSPYNDDEKRELRVSTLSMPVHEKNIDEESPICFEQVGEKVAAGFTEGNESKYSGLDALRRKVAMLAEAIDQSTEEEQEEVILKQVESTDQSNQTHPPAIEDLTVPVSSEEAVYCGDIISPSTSSHFDKGALDKATGTTTSQAAEGLTFALGIGAGVVSASRRSCSPLTTSEPIEYADRECRNKQHAKGLLLTISIDENEGRPSMDCSWQWGETTYRKDGLSIGQDYLRVDGKTIIRGGLQTDELVPLDRVLGKGSFSTVQLAYWKSNPNTKVAVKHCCLLETSKERRKQLLQELKLLSMLDSPGLVKLHGAFLEDDTVTTVLEYMNHGSLADLFKQTAKAFPESFAAAAIFQALNGLEYLHQQKILHRDIKPGNILLHSDGSVKFCDFGLASLSEDSLHQTAVGTTVYMSPERLRGQPYGRSSDIWSLGLIVLHFLTGLPPPWSHVKSLVDLLMTIEDCDPGTDFSPPECSNEAAEVVEACLQHDPAKRIPALLLIKSPWFTNHRIKSLENAQTVVQDYLVGAGQQEAPVDSSPAGNVDNANVSTNDTEMGIQILPSASSGIEVRSPAENSGLTICSTPSASPPPHGPFGSTKLFVESTEKSTMDDSTGPAFVLNTSRS